MEYIYAQAMYANSFNFDVMAWQYFVLTQVHKSKQQNSAL